MYVYVCMCVCTDRQTDRQELNESKFMVLASPWDEEHVKAKAVVDYNAPELQPDKETVYRGARGSQIKKSLTYKHV